MFSNTVAWSVPLKASNCDDLFTPSAAVLYVLRGQVGNKKIGNVQLDYQNKAW